MFCINCGKQVGEEYEFCPECGSAIPRIANCDIEKTTDLKSVVSDISSIESSFESGGDPKTTPVDQDNNDCFFCTECGKKVDALFDYCPECGTKVYKCDSHVVNTSHSNTSGDFDAYNKMPNKKSLNTLFGNRKARFAAFLILIGLVGFAVLNNVHKQGTIIGLDNTASEGDSTNDSGLISDYQNSNYTQTNTQNTQSNIADASEHQTNADLTNIGDAFASDWRPGYENKYGYGQEIEGFNRGMRYMNYIVQDAWIYYSSNSKIYKMPIGGNASTVKILYTSMNTNEYTIPIAVVKDWVYFSMGESICRIRTDAQYYETIVNDVSGWNEFFYVVEDNLYYISKVRQGAQTSTDYLTVVNTNTGATRQIAECNRCHLWGGYKDSLFLNNYDDGLYRCDLNGNYMYSMSDVYAQDMPTLMNCDTEQFFVRWGGSRNGFKRYWSDKNNHITEIAEYSVEGPVYGDFISGHTYLSYANGLHDTSYDGDITINSDQGIRDIVLWGDGYIYYTAYRDFAGSYTYNLDERLRPVQYRIKPDGSGFEDVSWMYP